MKMKTKIIELKKNEYIKNDRLSLKLCEPLCCLVDQRSPNWFGDSFRCRLLSRLILTMLYGWHNAGC